MNNATLEAIPDAFLFPIERVDRQQNQPRQEFDEAKIAAIAASIKKGMGRRVGGSGLIQPLLVRWAPGAVLEDGTISDSARVEIVAGETRYHAALRAGLEKIPLIVTDMNSEEAYEDAITENILRGDLTAEDEGRAFQYLKNRYDLSALGLAKRLYDDASREGYIQSRLDMLRLSPIVRPLIGRRSDTITAARRIQSIANEETQRELVQFMLAGGTFKELNQKIQKIKGITPGDKDDRQNRRLLAEAFPSGTSTRTPFSYSEDPELESRIAAQSDGGSKAESSKELEQETETGENQTLDPSVAHVIQLAKSSAAQMAALVEAMTSPELSLPKIPAEARGELARHFVSMRASFRRAESEVESAQ